MCTIYMVRSIGGTGFVRCREVVRFSESPLLEVSLYIPYACLLKYDYSGAHVFLATLCILAVNVCGCVHLAR